MRYWRVRISSSEKLYKAANKLGAGVMCIWVYCNTVLVSLTYLFAFVHIIHVCVRDGNRYFHSDASNRRHSRFLIGLRVVWKAETHDATPKVTDAGEKRRYSYVTVSDMRMGSKSERAKQLERKGERNCV